MTNVGKLSPASTNVVPNRSRQLPGWRADVTPSGIPVIIHNTAAPTATEAVTGSRSRIVSSTERWL